MSLFESFFGAKKQESSPSWKEQLQFITLWQILTDEPQKVTSLAPPWQHPPSSTCQCQVTISQVPPSITWDIPNDYTLCANANACQEVPWYKAWVSCSMTNDVPNEGWTSMSVLKSRRDFNYSSVWLPAWPSSQDLDRSQLQWWCAIFISGCIPFEWAEFWNGRLSKVVIIITWRSGGRKSLKSSVQEWILWSH